MGVHRFIKSFKYAFCGIGRCIREERNMRIHTAAAFYVLLFSPFFRFTRGEWGVLILTLSLVMAAECVNTAIERLCDRVGKEYSPLAKAAKDLAAGAVLLCALGAAAVGVCLFWRPEVFLEIAAWFSARPPAIAALLLSAVCLGLYCVLGFPETRRKKDKPGGENPPPAGRG